MSGLYRVEWLAIKSTRPFCKSALFIPSNFAYILDAGANMLAPGENSTVTEFAVHVWKGMLQRSCLLDQLVSIFVLDSNSVGG